MEQIETKKAQLSATMGDQQIIQLFFQRCEEAITQTQKKYGALCRSVAQRLLTDPRDTEECVSDTYLRVWNAIPPERPRSLRAYLARITRNLAILLPSAAPPSPTLLRNWNPGSFPDRVIRTQNWMHQSCVGC